MQVRFRLSGIDTPERGQPGYKEATVYLRGLLEGKDIIVISEKTGKYGRWLGLLTVDDLDINQMMIEAGHAVVYE